MRLSHEPFCFIPNQHKRQYLSHLIYLYGSQTFSSHLEEKTSSTAKIPYAFHFFLYVNKYNNYTWLSQIIKHIEHLLKSVQPDKLKFASK